MHLPILLWFPVLAVSVAARHVVHDLQDALEQYEEFKQTYKKNYANDDDHKRFGIFRENLKRAQKYQEHERGTAQYGVTKFSDLTPEEFIGLHSVSDTDENQQIADLTLIKHLGPAPANFDWRDSGAIGPVQNQGRCKSWWAFSVVENIEVQFFKKHGSFLKLSEQQLIDCNDADFNCDAGWPLLSYNAIQRMGGLEPASGYPYRERKEDCHMDKTKLVVSLNTSIVLPKDEGAQAAWLSRNGPFVSTLNGYRLQFYKFGIMHPWAIECISSTLNYAALTVGYGHENHMPYWIVKNSLGQNFGEAGYFRIYRGDGTCGINEHSTTAVITQPSI